MTVAEPTIVWKGTAGNNVWAGRGRRQKLAIVAHVMEGTIEGCAAWFAAPASKASANYGGYSSPELDDLLAQASRSIDTARRAELYGRLVLLPTD